MVLSLVGVGSGCAVVFGLLTARWMPVWTPFFLVSNALACLTGFLFSFHGMTFAIELGIPTIAFLMLAAIDRYSAVFAGVWRHSYVVSVMVAFYGSVVLLVAQIFARFLTPDARTPWEYGRLFKLTELMLFVVIAGVTWLALKRFRVTVRRVL